MMEIAQRLLSTRRGSMFVGIAAAGIAGLLLLLYLSQYRTSLEASAEPVTVLVAKNLIHKGTPGNVIGSTDLFQTTSVPKDQVRNGALTDAASLRGRVAATEIYPGQQLTAGDFGLAAAGSVSTSLTKDWRAIAVPVDSIHGVSGQIGAGDHVDIYVGFNVDRASGGGNVPVIKLMMTNTLVLQTSTGGSSSSIGNGGGGGSVILRATTQQAANLAFAADNGVIWMTLRPSANATATKPSLVTAQSLLLGIPPVTVARQIREFTGGAR
jgi:Flp pilus assembly protein CpaB